MSTYRKGQNTYIEVQCENCGKTFMRYDKSIGKHIFCSRECARGYLSKKMTEMNKELNPTRMREETRKKLSKAQQKGKNLKENCYPKRAGRHEHRTVAEQILGRSLEPNEVVHHIDGDKHNNDLSNIMIFKSQAEHARYHAKLRKEVKNDL